MERRLTEWYFKNNKTEKIDQNQLKDMALKFSTKPDFQASKGWIEKFKKKIEKIKKDVV